MDGHAKEIHICNKDVDRYDGGENGCSIKGHRGNDGNNDLDNANDDDIDGGSDDDGDQYQVTITALEIRNNDEQTMVMLITIRIN